MKYTQIINRTFLAGLISAALFFLYPGSLTAQQRMTKAPETGTLFDQLMVDIEFYFQNKEYGQAVTLIDERIDRLDTDVQKAEAAWKRSKMLVFQAVIEDQTTATGKTPAQLLERALESALLSLQYQPEENHFAWFYTAMTHMKKIELGLSGSQQPDYSDVIRCLKRSLQTHPDHYTAWSMLSSIARREALARHSPPLTTHQS